MKIVCGNCPTALRLLSPLTASEHRHPPAFRQCHPPAGRSQATLDLRVPSSGREVLREVAWASRAPDHGVDLRATVPSTGSASVCSRRPTTRSAPCEYLTIKHCSYPLFLLFCVGKSSNKSRCTALGLILRADLADLLTKGPDHASLILEASASRDRHVNPTIRC